MQQPVATTEATLRVLRTIHGALFCSILLYVVVIVQISPQDPRGNATVLLTPLGILSVLILGIAFFVRSRKIRPAFETLQTKPDDAESLRRWRVGALVSAALAESVVLYGVAIHFMGGTGRQAAPFFIAGAVAMLAWWPRRP